ncbi:aminoglycoside 3'-phosphotransferase [Agreia bicolorata]|uniref:Aminoglycoside phosphotransferase n=1 Tax=Agreia bicolorata TaxID=110935 RepID=A0ABR5CCM1_9MICO|nr:aminoglycoside 3'-phosphotransferase [Agreia bicolorata]KJC63383.1 aminoglycoside phosphotransferase [Agreia bicolorata]
MVIAAKPDGPVEVPSVVAELSSGDTPVPVWRNTLGGLTFRLGEGGAARFIKWMPRGEPSFEHEVARLRWAAPFIEVPRVLASGSGDDGSWMLMAGIPGHSAVDARFTSDGRAARVAARAIGAGLRRMHDARPVDSCPYSWSISQRIARAQAEGLAVDGALEAPPSIDRLVVCHGDACAPNTLLDDDGSFVGHVDLGSLGVADRWADLAVATWSLEWNYAGGALLESELLDAYGVARDAPRMRYYRALWAAT